MNNPEQELLALWLRIKELYPSVMAATCTVLIQDAGGYRYISNTFPSEEK